MSKFIFLAALILLPLQGVVASDDFRGFKTRATAANIKAFTKDLGGILGGKTFHGARALGFNGFNLGVVGAMQFKPDKNNTVLKGEGVDAFGLPWVQGEIGLPFKLDGFIRGFSYQGVTLAGGGLRWGLNAPKGEKFTPLLMVTWVGQALVHRDFSANHFGGNFVMSMPWPRVQPYLSAGADFTRLFVRNTTADASLVGAVVNTTEARFGVGAAIQLRKFFFLDVGYVNAHGQGQAEAGLGVQF